MHTYKVDHTGGCTSKTGEMFTYTAGVPVELPEDVAEALGKSAELVKKSEKHEDKKDEQEDKKEEKKEEKAVDHAPKDKMVKSNTVHKK